MGKIITKLLALLAAAAFSLCIASCSGNLYNDSLDDSGLYLFGFLNQNVKPNDAGFLQVTNWEQIKVLAACPHPDDRWDSASILRLNNIYYYSWYGLVDHSNSADSHIGSIDAVDPSSGTHQLVADITYSGHPYSSVFGFAVRSRGLIERNGTLYLLIWGNTASGVSNHSTAIIKSTDNGANWLQHQLVLTGDSNYSYQGIDLSLMGGDYYLYLLKKNNSTSAVTCYYIKSSDISFNASGTVQCNAIVGSLCQIFYYNSTFVGLWVKTDTEGKYQVYKITSDNPEFNDASSEEIIMPTGITTNDSYIIHPYFSIEGYYIYAIAVVQGSQALDYGFDNDIKLCLYRGSIAH